MKYRKSPLQIAKFHHVNWLNSIASDPHIPKDFPISKDILAKIEDQVKGKIVFPWTKGYDDDRQDFDNVYPAFPIMIVYAGNYEDIRIVLEIASENKILTALRSGGHSLAGYSVCDGIVIDLSVLNNMYVDVAAKTATIEAGCTFDKIFTILEQYGLHMPGGGCPTVAIAGFMQGGGYGLTSRAFGMNCDCVLEVTVMLADGKIVVANKGQNADLFWAVRGGTGGNFGALLSIKYQLFDLGNIWGRKVKWVIDQNPVNAAQAMYAIQENYLTPTAYPNLGIETVLTTDTDGLKKVFFCVSWIGTEADFDKALQPLQSVPGAEFGKKVTGKYSYVNTQVLDGTPNVPDDVMAYSQSVYIARSLTVTDWKNILSFFYSTAPNKYSMIDMECYGGKINSVPVASSAFIHRDVKMDFFVDAFFDTKTNDQKKNEEWTKSLFAFMNQYGNTHSYQNYPNRDQANFQWAYWGNYYNQLVLIKQKYDPTNFFHYQQSIGNTINEDLKKDQVILFEPNQIVYETY